MSLSNCLYVNLSVFVLVPLSSPTLLTLWFPAQILERLRQPPAHVLAQLGTLTHFPALIVESLLMSEQTAELLAIFNEIPSLRV